MYRGGSKTGHFVSDETKRKISESERGRVNVDKHNSPETEIQKGQHLSTQTEFKKGQRGKKAGHWKGGEIKSIQGYVYLFMPEHPKANKDGYVNRGRLILEQKLGRYLLDGYEPHHLNEIKDDDHPENLMEVSRSEHVKLHKNLQKEIRKDG